MPLARVALIYTKTSGIKGHGHDGLTFDPTLRAPMIRKTLLLTLAALSLTTAASADYIWATLDPATKTVAVGLQEVPSQTPLSLGERVPLVKAWTKDKKAVVLKGEATWLKGTVADEQVAAGLDYGVIDRRAQGRGLFWLEYYAKAALTPAASGTKLGLPVELSVAADATGRLTLTVLHEGKPAAKASVVAETGKEGEPFKGTTGEDGTLVLPTLAGPLAVRALVQIDGKGTEGGKAYDFRRRYGSLTVNAVSGAAKAPEKPFSRLLSESFGDNHTVVSHSGFIETIRGGKLTKAHLVDHLQQRALVHDALAKILDGAPGVPYGDGQRDVLKLLRADLDGLGAGWPEPAKAWPITTAFLEEIEESRAKGPFFALGILHVYYGGITNGGRDIGAMIADQTKFSPTYYLKSDGYRPYLKVLNETVSDPAARAETIRGGQAAYRYIIAINDDPRFKG